MWVWARVHARVWVCVRARACRDQRSISCVLLSHSPLDFLRQGFSDPSGWSTLIWLDWLANKLQEYFGFCLHGLGLQDALPHLAFMCVLEVEPRSYACAASPFPTEESPQHLTLTVLILLFILLNLKMSYNKKGQQEAREHTFCYCVNQLPDALFSRVTNKMDKTGPCP